MRLPHLSVVFIYCVIMGGPVKLTDSISYRTSETYIMCLYITIHNSVKVEDAPIAFVVARIP